MNKFTFQKLRPNHPTMSIEKRLCLIKILMQELVQDNKNLSTQDLKQAIVCLATKNLICDKVEIDDLQNGDGLGELLGLRARYEYTDHDVCLTEKPCGTCSKDGNFGIMCDVVTPQVDIHLNEIDG